jgi:hypothetical protein
VNVSLPTLLKTPANRNKKVDVKKQLKNDLSFLDKSTAPTLHTVGF